MKNFMFFMLNCKNINNLCNILYIKKIPPDITAIKIIKVYYITNKSKLYKTLFHRPQHIFKKLVNSQFWVFFVVISFKMRKKHWNSNLDYFS